MKKAQLTNAMIIGLVVAVIIGLIGLTITADLGSPLTEAQDANNELVTGSNSTYVDFANDDWATNATCNCTPFTASFVNGSAIWSNDSCDAIGVQCSYTYFDDSYVDNGTTRTIVDLFPVLFAVLVLIIISAMALFRK